MSPAFRLALLPLVLLACAPPATLSTHAPRGWAALHASEALTLTGALHRAIQGQRTVRVLLDVPFCEVYLTLVADHIHKVAVASADAPGELFRGTILDMRVFILSGTLFGAICASKATTLFMLAMSLMLTIKSSIKPKT